MLATHGAHAPGPWPAAAKTRALRQFALEHHRNHDAVHAAALFR